MKIHMFLIVAVVAISIIFITGSVRQANAMNILVSAGFDQIQTEEQQKAVSTLENIEDSVVTIEPAAG